MNTKLSIGIKLAFALLVSAFLGFVIHPVAAPVAMLAMLVMAFEGSVPQLALFDFLGTKITFNGEEAREGIIEPAFERPDLNAYITVVQDIVAKKQIAFLGRLNKVTKTDAGCGTGAQDKSIPMSEKFWEPERLKIWIRECADNLLGTFFVWGLNKGIQRKDLTQTDFWVYVMEVMSDATADDVQRIAWFGDKDADNVAGGGTIIDTSDVADYNQLNGFWKQIFVATAANHYDITENAGATFVDQDNLASDAALKIFRALLTTNADTRLKNRKDKFILCTTSIFENWLTYKETQSFDRSFERQENGYMTDVYRGVTIVAYDLWDRWIRADFQDGTAYYRPHRAICVTKDNLMLGLDAVNSLSGWEQWYNNDTEQNNMKGGYQADTKILFDFMVSAAY